MWYESSAPASLMLMGEYAVVEGFPALVIACDHRIFVRVRYRQDLNIHLFSEKYGTFQTDFNIQSYPLEWRFVLTAILIWKKKLNHGLEVEIHSDISDCEGLGSSAAVSVAMNHALMQLCKKTFSSRDLLRLVRRQIRKIQGMGSGADVAAAIYGGLIYYDPIYLRVISSAFPWNIFRYYLGYKTPTPEVFSRVQKAFINRKAEYQTIMRTIADCVNHAWQAIMLRNSVQFNEQIRKHQVLLQALGVCDDQMQLVINSLLQNSNILSLKISGSGLGDCLIGLSQSDIDINCAGISKIHISSEGVRHEQTSSR